MAEPLAARMAGGITYLNHQQANGLDLELEEKGKSDSEAKRPTFTTTLSGQKNPNCSGEMYLMHFLALNVSTNVSECSGLIAID